MSLTHFAAVMMLLIGLYSGNIGTIIAAQALLAQYPI